jgi:hypothetical protein
MRTRMNDAIHVEIEVIELLAVRVGSRGVNRNRRTIFHNKRLILDYRRYNLGISGRQPSKSRWDTHLVDYAKTVYLVENLSRTSALEADRQKESDAVANSFT